MRMPGTAEEMPVIVWIAVPDRAPLHGLRPAGAGVPGGGRRDRTTRASPPGGDRLCRCACPELDIIMLRSKQPHGEDS